MNSWAWTFFGAWLLAEWQVVALLKSEKARKDTGEWAMILAGSAA